MICPNCNQKIPNDSLFCIFCGKKTESTISDSDGSQQKQETNQINLTISPSKLSSGNGMKDLKTAVKKSKALKIIAVVGGLICCLLLIFSIVKSARTCKYPSCKNPKTSGSNYCNVHTCVKPDCNREVGFDSIYCYEHTPDDYGKISKTEAIEKAKQYAENMIELRFSVKKLGLLNYGTENAVYDQTEKEYTVTLIGTGYTVNDYGEYADRFKFNIEVKVPYDCDLWWEAKSGKQNSIYYD